MKKLLILSIIALFSFNAYAQHSVNTVDQKGFNKIFFSYSPSSLTITNDYFDKTSSGINTFGLSYTRSQVLAKIPLYIEFGVEANYLTKNIDEVKYNMVSAMIPVNIAYRLSFGGGKMHLTPYTGPCFKFNIWGEAKTTYMGEEQTHDLMEDVNRFQLGWQAGVGFSIKKFYINAGYIADLSNIVKEVNSSIGGFRCGIGIVF